MKTAKDTSRFPDDVRAKISASMKAYWDAQKPRTDTPAKRPSRARPNLMGRVIALVTERGRATVDDILPDCDGFTRAKVLGSLQNAKSNGHLRLITKGTHGNRNAGAVPSVYGPLIDPEAIRPANSIWEMADRAAQEVTA